VFEMTVTCGSSVAVAGLLGNSAEVSAAHANFVAAAAAR
jgi:hypothetical protein